MAVRRGSGGSSRYPADLAAVSYFTEQTALLGIAVIWIAQLLGYGLKYETDFMHTHLLRV